MARPSTLSSHSRSGSVDAVAGQPGVPRLELVVGERVVEALHPPQVVDRGELGGDRAADLLGGRVGRAELGELLLELLQPAQLLVVVGVGEGRLVPDEVAPPRVLDQVDELLVLVAGLGGLAGVGGGSVMATSCRTPHRPAVQTDWSRPVEIRFVGNETDPYSVR